MVSVGDVEMSFDAVVVLGGGVGVGSASHYRVLKAIEILGDGLSDRLILTGSREEMLFMKSVAIGRASPDRIVECEPSRTTVGNAYYVKLKALELNLRRLAVVTSYYHVERARKIFEWVLGEGFEIELFYNSNEPANAQAEERERRLILLTPILTLFKKGDHETIMRFFKSLELE